MTPMQLSLQYLRKSGWVCEVVEQNVRIRRRPPQAGGAVAEDDLTFKRDLLGFADILCLKRGHILLVQTTSVSNVAARVAKIRGLVMFEHAKQAGIEIHVHGWGSSKINGGLRIVDLTFVPTDWSTIVKAGHRSRKTPRRQIDLDL